jgi:hypothetical protein
MMDELLIVLKEIRDELKWHSKCLDKIMVNTGRTVKPCSQDKEKNPEAERLLNVAMGLLKFTPGGLGGEIEKLLKEGGIEKDGK